MNIWKSNPIDVDGIEVQVQASADGVTFGKTVEGVYASDLLLTPEQACNLAEALTQAAAKCLAAGGKS